MRTLLGVAAVAALGIVNLGMSCGPGETFPDPPEQQDTCIQEAPPADGQAAVLLGQGPSGAFVELGAQAPVKLNYGPQGGQHVYVSIKLYSPTAAQWTYALQLTNAAGASVGGTQIALDACGGKWTFSENVQVFVYDTSVTNPTLRLEAKSGSESLVVEVPITIEP